MKRTPTRQWDFPAVTCLILMLLAASQRLYTTHWAWELGSSVIFALVGVLIGLLLGYSKFERQAVSWLTFGFSLPVFVLTFGWFLYAGISWLERLVYISSRFANALGLFLTGKPVHDTLLFVVFMALVFWIASLMAGFALTRYGDFVGSVLPAGIILVVILLYDSGKGSSQTALAVYLFFSLLLLGRLTYLQRRQFWKEKRITLLGESKTELNMLYSGVALASILVVWLAPTSLQSFRDLKTAWDNFTSPFQYVREDLNNAVAGLQSQPPAPSVAYFGNALPLGLQAASGASVYFRVQTPETITPTRYYWRVRSYNIFLGDQWYAESVPTFPFAADHSSLSLADGQGTQQEFTVTIVSADLAGLATPARPVWISVPSELFALKTPDGKLDPIQFQPDSPVRAGTQYSVRTEIYVPTIMQLRSAGDSYPEWVTTNYLQLPDDLPAEITALAQRLTARSRTSYDMAVAITQYLRSNYTYSVTVDPPPTGQEALDWFLFHSRMGFCNYYASAEVVLLRSVGIPSRLVVGFAQGESDGANGFVVREGDAHAWPEAYFPGIGWVEFEPTGNQAPLARPLGNSPASEGGGATETPFAPTPVVPQTPSHAAGILANWISPILADWFIRFFLAFVFLNTFLRLAQGSNSLIAEEDLSLTSRSFPATLVRLIRKRALNPPAWLVRWSYLSGLNPLERAFSSVYSGLRWMGEAPSLSLTPAEAASELSRLLPTVSGEIQTLLAEYQKQIYSPLRGYLPLARRAVRTIRRAALRAAIRRRLDEFRGI